MIPTQHSQEDMTTTTHSSSDPFQTPLGSPNPSGSPAASRVSINGSPLLSTSDLRLRFSVPVPDTSSGSGGHTPSSGEAASPNVSRPASYQLPSALPVPKSPGLAKHVPYAHHRHSSVPFSSSTLFRRELSSRSLTSARRPWPSTMLKGEIEKPWLKHPDPAQRWVKAVFWSLFSVGIIGAALVCYQGYASIPSLGKTCLVMSEDFSNGINADYWNHEVRVDGYGNKQFEWTTASSNNSFVQDNTLYIVPTLTADVIGTGALTDGFTLNLTADGSCSSTNVSNCVAISNSSTDTIINPVQAARLTTQGKITMKYGKVEVEARMPTGDWLWPAIWMLPEDSVYGDWPLSGEIDIAESRGNGFEYTDRGADYLSSTLHWGPLQSMDSYWRTWGVVKDKVNGYNSGFHKYTLEWDDKYLMTYIDSKINKIYGINFKKSFWDLGSFPAYYQNGTDQQKLLNPWVKSNSYAAPFDQSFYLILDVAVGGQNGYFPDNLGNKPWNDGSTTAMADFWAAKDRWYPTWPTDHTKRGLAVKSVKMWQKC